MKPLVKTLMKAKTRESNRPAPAPWRPIESVSVQGFSEIVLGVAALLRNGWTFGAASVRPKRGGGGKWIASRLWAEPMVNGVPQAQVRTGKSEVKTKAEGQTRPRPNDEENENVRIPRG
jgi:hypothetical protein